MLCHPWKVLGYHRHFYVLPLVVCTFVLFLFCLGRYFSTEKPFSYMEFCCSRCFVSWSAAVEYCSCTLYRFFYLPCTKSSLQLWENLFLTLWLTYITASCIFRVLYSCWFLLCEKNYAMDKCRFHSESMYAYLQLINLSTTIHGPPPMYCMIFLGPPHFSCMKMMAHPHFFSSPPPPVLYDQSLTKN